MLSNLHILRVFATLSVVYFHVAVISASYGQAASYFHFLWSWGEFSIDLFFIVSGFVMVMVQTAAKRSAWDFLKNRLIRIIPIYWLLTLSLLMLFTIFPLGFKGGPPSWLHATSSFLFLSGMLVDQKPILYVGWTLEYEMLFYLFFALGIALRKDLLLWLVPCLALVLLTVLELSRVVALDFVMGMLCAQLYLQGRFKSLAPAAFLMSLAWLAYMVFVDVDVNRPWTALPAFLMIFGLVNIRQVSSRYFNYLGDAAFSIYLGQVFTIPAFYKLISKVPLMLPADLLALFALVATTLFGCFLHEYFEKPMTRFFKKRFL